MTNISVRYIVDDVDAAVDFYTSLLKFEVAMRPGPGFAMLRRGELRLLLNSPGGGGGEGQTLAEGTRPEPGGWNRFQLQVDELDEVVADVRKAGADLRGAVITGRGGRQALVPDPAGNPVELFEPSLDRVAVVTKVNF
ncbi:MAG: VOC family protein [Mycobacterium sp.]